MSSTWITPSGVNVFNQIATSSPVQSLEEAFNSLECQEGLIKYNLMWNIANGQWLIVEPQIRALRALLETTLPAYELLDDTLKFSYAIGKPVKPKLVPKLGTKGGRSCLGSNSLSGAVSDALLGVTGGLNRLIFSGISLQNQLTRFVSNFLNSVAKSWLNGSDLILFPLIEALDSIIKSTGIGNNLKEMVKLKTCIKSHCKKIKESDFKDISRFYINGSLVVPVDSKGNLNISKLWIFDVKGTGLNTIENRALLMKLKSRYDKYKREKARLIVSNFSNIFNLLATSLNEAFSSIGSLPGNLIDTSTVFIENLTDLGTGVEDYLASLSSAGNMLDTLDISNVLNGALKSLESTYLIAVDSATPAYTKAYESSTGKSNNTLKSSSSISTYF